MTDEDIKNKINLVMAAVRRSIIELEPVSNELHNRTVELEVQLEALSREVGEGGMGVEALDEKVDAAGAAQENVEYAIQYLEEALDHLQGQALPE